MLGLSTYYHHLKRLRKEIHTPKDTQITDLEKIKYVTYFSLQKKKEVNAHFFKSKRYVFLNKQVQTFKFTKKETDKTGVSTCRDSHKPVTNTFLEACPDREGL